MPVSGLKSFQQEIVVNTLYALTSSGVGSEQGRPSLEVVGTGVSIYGSQALPSSPPAGMALTRQNFTGLDSFGIIPNYIYLTGTATSIVLTGVSAKVIS